LPLALEDDPAAAIQAITLAMALIVIRLAEVAALGLATAIWKPQAGDTVLVPPAILASAIADVHMFLNINDVDTASTRLAGNEILKRTSYRHETQKD
jgi:hypothetical protein